MEETKRNCELCIGQAAVYCPSDNAFLCYTCDSKVHSANFLVARHVRSLICSFCGILDGNRFSGAGIPPIPTTVTVSCRNCTPTAAVENVGDGDSLSSYSSCVSSTGEADDEVETTSFRKRKEKVSKVNVKRRETPTVVTDLKIEGILVNWCRRMGGVVEEREIGTVVNIAVQLLTGYLDGITSLPFRVSLAASFWVAVRIVDCRRRGGAHARGSSSSTGQDLRRVEQISGVPAKLILATEARLARVIKRKRSREGEDHREGWAEC